MASIDEFIKYPRIPHLVEIPKLLNYPIEVYEKLDGGNVQVRKINGRVVCGSRAHYLRNPKYFTQGWFKDFQRWTLSNYSFYEIPENVIIYGEWLARHTLNYKQEFTDRFFFIDLLDFDEGAFVEYGCAKSKIKNWGVEDVLYLNTLAEGEFKLENLEKMVGGSDFREGDREGLIVKNYILQRFAKLWTSSVKRRLLIDDEDISRTIYSLQENAQEINVKNITDEILEDYQRSTNQILGLEDIERIKLKVRNYLSILTDKI